VKARAAPAGAVASTVGASRGFELAQRCAAVSDSVVLDAVGIKPEFRFVRRSSVVAAVRIGGVLRIVNRSIGQSECECSSGAFLHRLDEGVIPRTSADRIAEIGLLLG